MQPAHWCPALRVPCAHSPFIPRSRPWEVITRPFVGKRNRASQGQPGEGRKELDLDPPESCSRLYPQPSLCVSTALSRPPARVCPQSHQDTLAWPTQHQMASADMRETPKSHTA